MEKMQSRSHTGNHFGLFSEGSKVFMVLSLNRLGKEDHAIIGWDCMSSHELNVLIDCLIEELKNLKKIGESRFDGYFERMEAWLEENGQKRRTIKEQQVIKAISRHATKDKPGLTPSVLFNWHVKGLNPSQRQELIQEMIEDGKIFKKPYKAPNGYETELICINKEATAQELN